MTKRNSRLYIEGIGSDNEEFIFNNLVDVNKQDNLISKFINYKNRNGHIDLKFINRKCAGIINTMILFTYDANNKLNHITWENKNFEHMSQLIIKFDKSKGAN